MKGKRIYLDYASLTPIDPGVVREMKKYSGEDYANPSSLYAEGVAAKKALNDGRARTADFIRAHSNEIVFTSGGTEANGLAIEGAFRAAVNASVEHPHLIISNIEHSSILEIAAMLGKYGCEVTRIAVNEEGIISLDELRKAIKPTTFLVSIMTVNNEIGTIQPIREIAKVIRQSRERFRGPTSGRSALRSDLGNAYPLFHTDAAQAASFMDLNVEKFGVDLMTLDGSKVYGPRGIGCLYTKRGTKIEPIILGGGQESGMRSGTENIPAIMGFAKALEIIEKQRSREADPPSLKLRRARKERSEGLKDLFIKGLREIRTDIKVNGAEGGHRFTSLSESDEKVVTFQKPQKGHDVPAVIQAPHILNVSIPGIDNEFFVLQLDARGIACSTKSSCLRDQDESYVLKAIGADSKTSVRFSFGRWTKESDLKRALRAIKEILGK